MPDSDTIEDTHVEEPTDDTDRDRRTGRRTRCRGTRSRIVNDETGPDMFPRAVRRESYAMRTANTGNAPQQADTLRPTSAHRTRPRHQD